MRILREETIPRVIHYCWFGPNDIPEAHKKNIESWKRFNPNYKIVQWNESNYDVSANNYTMEAYDKKRWAFVSDVARLDIIYKYGGIYFDTDVEVIRNLDDFLYQHSFFGTEDGFHVSTGLGFGAEKQSRVIKKLLDIYSNIHFIDEFGKEDTLSCPKRQLSCFCEMGWKKDGNIFSSEQMTIYPRFVLSCTDHESGIEFRNKYTFTIHHSEASWLEGEEKEKWDMCHKLPSMIGKEI